MQLFTGDIPEAEAVANQYQLEMVLPQKGTSIIIRPHPVAETDNPFSEEEDGNRKYMELFDNLVNREISLKWNKEKGIFDLVK